MPFDGIEISCRSVGLTETLSRLGITSIDPDVLTEHKAQQVAAHPGNFAYRYRHLLSMALSLGLWTSFIASFVFAVFGQIFAPVVVPVIVTILVVAATELVVIRQPARWTETELDLYSDRQLVKMRLPRPIYALLCDLRDEMGYNRAIRLIYGELSQDEIVLDPYLIMVDRKTGARCILAIWDGDTILHIAQ